MALSEAYEELLAINEPGSLNIIIFFTDGLPNGITADFPIKRVTDTRYGYGTDGDNSTSSTIPSSRAPVKMPKETSMTATRAPLCLSSAPD